MGLLRRSIPLKRDSAPRNDSLWRRITRNDNFMFQINKNKKSIKALVITLELLAIAIIIYLIALPLWPAVKYKLVYQGKAPNIDWQDIEVVKEKTEDIISDLLQGSAAPQSLPPQREDCGDSTDCETATRQLPQSEYSVSPNRVIIPKIGVNAPIVESENQDYALSRGAWRLSDSSTPDKAGNTVITGHRFKYLPPSNLTFYLFHKLEAGDIVSLVWQEKYYYYKIKEIKIVSADDASILGQTDKPTLTMFTCDPIYSQKNRLVVVGELMLFEP